MTIITIILLCIPTAWKVYRDRNGVVHPDREGVEALVFMIVGCSALPAVIKLLFIVFNIIDEPVTINLIGFVQNVILSSCIYASVFPYWINYVHLRRGVTTAKHSKPITVFDKHKLMWRTEGHIVSTVSFSQATVKDIINHIITHLSDSAWPDKTWWWRKLGPYGRLIVNALILTAGIVIYNL